MPKEYTEVIVQENDFSVMCHKYLSIATVLHMADTCHASRSMSARIHKKNNETTTCNPLYSNIPIKLFPLT